MSVPYTRVVECVAESGVRNGIVLPVPVRGTLTRLVVSQVDGVLAGFSFALYDRGESCDVYASVSEHADDVGVHSPASHQLVATQTAAALAGTLALFEKVIPYVNQDDADPISGRRQQKLHLCLIPAGSGEKHFEVAYTVLSPHIS